MCSRCAACGHTNGTILIFNEVQIFSCHPRILTITMQRERKKKFCRCSCFPRFQNRGKYLKMSLDLNEIRNVCPAMHVKTSQMPPSLGANCESRQQICTMATSAAGVSLSPSRARALPMIKAELLKPQLPSHARLIPVARGGRRLPRRLVLVASAPSTPPDISEKVQESIKKAEETCAEGAATGECAAAWDEVEELSAAASHARDNLKANSDPLENYCKDNPDSEECRTYD